MGWPWTENDDKSAMKPSVTTWPKFSIITPSFQRADFLEKTIRSVLLQDYPDLEYIIIDGGSQDGSVELMQKYSEHLSYWVSEPDVNQADALNKGLRQCTGDIIAFINSDDFYLPGALRRAAQLLIGIPIPVGSAVLSATKMVMAIYYSPGRSRRCLLIAQIGSTAGRPISPLAFGGASASIAQVNFVWIYLTHSILNLPFACHFMTYIHLMCQKNSPYVCCMAILSSSPNPEIYPLEAQIYYPDFGRLLTSAEMPPFFWRQVRREYGKRLKKSSVNAYLYVAGQAIRHPVWFSKGMRWWSQEQARKERMSGRRRLKPDRPQYVLSDSCRHHGFPRV